MKPIKFTLVFFFFLLIFSDISAQSARFGLRIGTNLSTVLAPNNIDLDEATKFRTGYNIAFIPEIAFNDIYSFQPEVNFIQKGYQFDNDNQFSFNYLEAHLLSKLKFGPKTVRGFFEVGPSVGAFIEGESNINGVKTKLESGINADYRRYEIGLVIGAGVAINFDLNQLFFDIRYLHGITAVDDTFRDNRITNQSVAFGVGFLFGFGGGVELDND